jgi:hypothetical protein
MKKNSFYIPLLFLITTIHITKSEEVGADNKSNAEQELEARIEAEREDMGYLLSKKEAIPILIGALGLGALAGTLDAQKSGLQGLRKAGAISIATLGAGVIGEFLALSLAEYNRHKIDSIIDKRTSLSKLEELSGRQSLLFIAAYRRNLPFMKLLINYDPEFMKETGIWKALTELFFNAQPTKGRVERLKKFIAEIKIR